MDLLGVKRQAATIEVFLGMSFGCAFDMFLLD